MLKCKFFFTLQALVQKQVYYTQLRKNISRQENKPVLESGLHVLNVRSAFITVPFYLLFNETLLFHLPFFWFVLELLF